MLEKEDALICCQCNVPLERIEARFNYLRNTFSAQVPTCPKCGQVYISEELVRSKVVQVEQLLEDK